MRGFMAAFPTPTVERGAVMSHAAMPGMTNMAGMQHGTTPAAASPGPMQAMDHSTMPMASDSAKVMDHSSMPGMRGGTSAAPSTAVTSREMAALHARMMADPVIRARVNADPVMRRLMQNAMNISSGPTVGRAAGSSAAKRVTSARKTTKPTTTRAAAARTKTATAAKKPAATTRKPVAKPAAAKPKPKPKADPMAGMDHSKMNMPPKK